MWTTPSFINNNPKKYIHANTIININEEKICIIIFVFLIILLKASNKRYRHPPNKKEKTKE